jgi:hypothetical protein
MKHSGGYPSSGDIGGAAASVPTLFQTGKGVVVHVRKAALQKAKEQWDTLDVAVQDTGHHVPLTRDERQKQSQDENENKN